MTGGGPGFFPRLGWIESVVGLTCVGEGPRVPIGEFCWITGTGHEPVPAEVVGFRPGGRTLLMPLSDLHGLQPGDVIRASGRRFGVPLSTSVLGRLIDGLGHPLDGGPEIMGAWSEVRGKPLPPLERGPIREVFWSGVRAIDGFLTLGHGQRIGIFSGAGVGKSTLLQMLLQAGRFDVAVVALVGERGREVSEFYHALDAATKRRVVTVAATSDQPPLLRLRSMDTACRVAEWFRERGKRVFFLADSLTRVALAAREVGLAQGEPPTARGFPASVFVLLPQLLERAGVTQEGTITACYTVLLDSDDPNDPIGDSVRGLIDGNIYLSRELAERHQFPAVDVVKSLSRVMPDLISQNAWELSGRLRRLVDRYERSRDFMELGAYQRGQDPELDRAIDVVPLLYEWLRQDRELDPMDPEAFWERLGTFLETEVPF